MVAIHRLSFSTIGSGIDDRMAKDEDKSEAVAGPSGKREEVWRIIFHHDTKWAKRFDVILLWLIGATTYNPFFYINSALISRSRIFELKRLEPEDLKQLLQRALEDSERGLGNTDVTVSDQAIEHLPTCKGQILPVFLQHAVDLGQEL